MERRRYKRPPQRRDNEVKRAKKKKKTQDPASRIVDVISQSSIAVVVGTQEGNQTSTITTHSQIHQVENDSQKVSIYSAVEFVWVKVTLRHIKLVPVLYEHRLRARADSLDRAHVTRRFESPRALRQRTLRPTSTFEHH